LLGAGSEATRRDLGEVPRLLCRPCWAGSRVRPRHCFERARNPCVGGCCRAGHIGH